MLRTGICKNLGNIQCCEMLKHYWWTLLLSSWFHEATTFAFPVTMGLEFAVALPRLMDEDVNTFPVLFIVTTIHTERFKVKFHFLDKTKYIRVSNMAAGRYLLPDKYELDVQVGPKPSYHLESDIYPFGLMVHLFNTNTSASSLTALPVASWGTHYYTVSLRGKPSFQIISSNYQNNIVIKMVIFLNNFTISYNNTIYNNSNNFYIVLEKFEAFAISACADDIYEEGGMTSTQIIGASPIGVVSGNCMTATETYTCFKNVKVKRSQFKDGTAEMLLPSEYFGTEFIVMTLPSRRVPSEVNILCPSEKTHAVVNMSVGFTGVIRTFYIGLIDIFHIEIAENFKLSSNLPIQLVYIQRSVCFYDYLGDIEEYGDATLSIVLPMSLFYVAYTWSNPNYAEFNYAIVIAPFVRTKQLYLNKNLLHFKGWGMVAGAPHYRVGHVPTTHESNFIDSHPTFRFGCYLYGYSQGTAYMHPAGFQDCKLSKEKHLIHDNIDNDCDGRIDEEKRNKKDDDNDTLIDEDLGTGQNVNGEWGPWKEWTCYENCSFPLLYRRRLCENPPPQEFGEPCPGPVEEFADIVCYPKQKCPEIVCGKKKWGPSCLWDCSHCSGDCNKFNGSCNFCISGWKNSEHACDQECGLYEWGENCLYSCYDKCWADCIDRETGECSPVTILMTVLPWILCFGFISATILTCHKKREREDILLDKSDGDVTEVLDETTEPTESKELKRKIVKMKSKEKKQVKTVKNKVWKWLMTSKPGPSIDEDDESSSSYVSEEESNVNTN